MTTLLALADNVRTEADAYRHLEELRWPSGVECPHCHSREVTLLVPENGISRKATNGSLSERRVWQCRPCRRQFSAISGTVMHGTKASVRVWVLVIFDMIAARNGISAREVSRKYGVCPRTAWFMLHRIREAMRSDALLTTMRGTIQADETWVGGDPRNRHGGALRPSEYVRIDPTTDKIPYTDKLPVFSLINAETGEARSRVVPDIKGHTLRKVMAEQVDMAASHLQTDEGSWYQAIGREFAAHTTVNHSIGEYSRQGTSTNRVEGYFGQFKRSLDGTYHHVSKTHLQRYLDEFDFRYSTCNVSDTERMAAAVLRADGKRLTYKRVKAAPAAR